MTSSNGNIFRVNGHLCGEFNGPGDFPAQRPVTRSFDAFFDLRLTKRLSKQSRGWWFETVCRPLWRHCNETAFLATINNKIIRVATLPFQWELLWLSSVVPVAHYNDVIMSAIASQITGVTIVYSTVCSGVEHWSTAWLAFARGIHRWPVNSPHKGPVTRKMYPFDDGNMNTSVVWRRCVNSMVVTQKIKSSNGRLWGCQTGAKSEHPKVVQNSSFEWVVEWLL